MSMQRIFCTAAMVAAAVAPCHAASEPDCRPLPPPGSTVLFGAKAVRESPHAAGIFALRNALPMPAVAVLKDEKNRMLQALVVAPGSGAWLAIPANVYGLEISFGNRWCNFGTGFADGLRFNVTGGVKVDSNKGLLATLLANSADSRRPRLQYQAVALPLTQMPQAYAVKFVVDPKGAGADRSRRTQNPSAEASGSMQTNAVLDGFLVPALHFYRSALQNFHAWFFSQPDWLQKFLLYGTGPIVLAILLLTRSTPRPRKFQSNKGGDQTGWYNPKEFRSEQTTYSDIPRLILVCAGDKAKAERLISYEQRLDSLASREVAASRALDRWERDRR